MLEVKRIFPPVQKVKGPLAVIIGVGAVPTVTTVAVEAEEQVEEKKVEDDDKNNTIFMPLDVKLQKKTYYTHDDYSRIFKSLPELQKMLTDMPKNAFLKKDDPDYEEKKKEIVKYNIEFIKNIFFGDETTFSYKENNFFITKSDYKDIRYKKNEKGEVSLYIPTIELTLMNFPIIGRINFNIKTKGDYTTPKDVKIPYTFDMSAPLGSAPLVTNDEKTIFMPLDVKLEKNPAYKIND